jgi:hypothetical protein
LWHPAGQPPVVVPTDKHGLVHGGQQPLSGATIQLYAVGTTGDGSASTPLLSPAPVSDANGGFNLTGRFTCPSPSSLVYLLATGGNPGLAPGTNNAALSMMAALGPCGSLSASTFIFVDELTTVAAVYSLAPFMTSASAIGSAPADAAMFAGAFTLANELANTADGTTPGTGVPTGESVPIAEINTIADILSTCVNSAGGVSGDNSACGDLFSLTTPDGLTPATDTITALLHLANNPTLNTAALYNLVTPTAPFQPELTLAPPDFRIRLTPATSSMALQFNPASVTFPPTVVGSASGIATVTIQNTGSAQVTLSGIGIVGSNASDFGQTNTCNTALQPASSCVVQLTVTPGAAGSRNGYLSVMSNTPDSPQYVTLAAVGSAAPVTPVPPVVPAAPSAVAGAVAEYPMDDGAGTTVRDISGSGNNATFAGGPNAPSWLPYGVAFLNAATGYSNNQWIDTPLTTFGTAYVAYCTPTDLGMTTGTGGVNGVASAPTLIGSSSTTSGAFLSGSNLVQIGHMSVQPSIFSNAGVTSSVANQTVAGCHIFAFSMGSSQDHFTVDGIEPPYLQQGGSNLEPGKATTTIFS